MARKPVPINPQILRWALDESGITDSELAATTKVDAEVVAGWLAGESMPSKTEFDRIVAAVRRPSSVFFLPEPPTATGVPTAFRRAPGLGGHSLSTHEVREIRWARRLQQIISWSSEREGHATVELPTVSVEATPPGEAAGLARTWLGVTFADQVRWSSANEAFRAWRGQLEANRVLVFQLSLGKGGLRGFSAWNEHAPLVAVNTAYHPSARVYTLFHELAHLLARTDSACLRFIAPEVADDRQERWCERFAADFLLPSAAFREFVQEKYGISSNRKLDDPNTARLIANRVHVSTRAVAIRLQELELAPSGLYGQVQTMYESLDWNDQGGGGGGGMTAPEKRLSQLGSLAPEALFEARTSGVLHTREVMDYLKLTRGQLTDLGSMLGESVG